MKKHMLILAGSAMLFASCGSNNDNQQSEQAKMDSIAAANAALQDEINQKRNDSTINAMAMAKADSMAAVTTKTTSKTKTTASGGTKTKTTTKTTTIAPPSVAPTPKQATIGNGKPKMNNAGNATNPDGTIGNGKPKMK